MGHSSPRKVKYWTTKESAILLCFVGYAASWEHFLNWILQAKYLHFTVFLEDWNFTKIINFKTKMRVDILLFWMIAIILMYTYQGLNLLSVLSVPGVS